MTITTTAQTYEEVALANPDRKLELNHGEWREKAGMSWDHGGAIIELAYQLRDQLDRNVFQVRIEGRVRRETDSYFIPDLFVVPTSYGDPFRGRPNLAIFPDPLPLVVEGWSPSTGAFDLATKLPVYQARGDREIWRLHPYERTLTAWRRKDDGSYNEETFTGGTIQPIALPGVTIDLDALWI